MTQKKVSSSSIPTSYRGDFGIVGDVRGTSLSNSEIFFAYFVANSILAIADARKIENSGRNTKNIHLYFWAIFVIPVYLLQRSRALGQHYYPFFVWIGLFITSIFISNPEMLSGNVYWGVGIPSCSSPSVTREVKEIFGNIPLMRLTSVRAVEISRPTEVSATDRMRNRNASISASNATDYRVKYAIEARGDQFYIELNINQ